MAKLPDQEYVTKGDKIRRRAEGVLSPFQYTIIDEETLDVLKGIESELRMLNTCLAEVKKSIDVVGSIIEDRE